MTRLALFSFAIAALAIGTGSGCAKPTDADCRKALANMRHLMGTENLHDEGRLESEVRRCRGGSSKKAVACAIKAQTLDELRHCEFFKVPENLVFPGSAGSGSAATPPAGSGDPAGPGSVEAGSAGGSGSAAGSAPTAGSATGSVAPTGSAASPGAAAGAGVTSTGSAVGSAK